MDDSEVYIEMSEKSPLQEMWQPSEWDYIYCKIEKQVVVLSGYETDSGYYGHGIKCLECHGVDPKSWHYDHFCLFRQDQLQILSGLSWIGFDNQCIDYWFQDSKHEITKEQAGIRVVMNCQFNKKWQEGEWLDKTIQ